MIYILYYLSSKIFLINVHLTKKLFARIFIWSIQSDRIAIFPKFHFLDISFFKYFIIFNRITMVEFAFVQMFLVHFPSIISI